MLDDSTSDVLSNEIQINLIRFKEELFRIFPMFETSHYYKTEEEYIPIMKTSISTFLILVKVTDDTYYHTSNAYLKDYNQCIKFIFKYDILDQSLELYKFYMMTLFKDAVLGWNVELMKIIIKYNHNNFPYIISFITFSEKYLWNRCRSSTVYKHKQFITSDSTYHYYIILLYNNDEFYDEFDLILELLFKIYKNFRFNLVFNESELIQIYDFDELFLKSALLFNNIEIISSLAYDKVITNPMFDNFNLSVYYQVNLEIFDRFVSNYKMKYFNCDYSKLFSHMIKAITQHLYSYNINHDYLRQYFLILRKLYKKCRMRYPLYFDIFTNEYHIIRQRLRSSNYSDRKIEYCLKLCIKANDVECAEIFVKYIIKHSLKIALKEYYEYNSKPVTSPHKFYRSQTEEMRSLFKEGLHLTVMRRPGEQFKCY